MKGILSPNQAIQSNRKINAEPGENKMKVLVTSQIDAQALSLLQEHAVVETLDVYTKERLLARVGAADILLVKMGTATRENIDKEVIDRGKNLKLIARHGAGYENVDLAYATQKGIVVTCTLGSNAVSVAEHTFGLLLSVARRYWTISSAVKAGSPDWTAVKGMELYEKTMGIIGMGHIGRRAAKIAQAFGMPVIAYHPRPSAQTMRDLGVEFVNLKTLLQQSDIVSIHAALTAETQGLIGAEELALMKKTAILLNTARGKIIDEAALVKALRTKQIAAAGLDVVIDDPVKKDNPLLQLENAFVMPHQGSKTVEAQKRTAMWTVDDIVQVIRGKRPQRVINPEVFNSH